MNDYFNQLYDTALAAGLPIISTDTAAKILAVTYVHGNNEFMVHSPKFKAEIRYIQKKWGIDGGLIPDAGITIAIQHDVDELERFEKEHPEERYPQWAIELFKTRYGFELIN